jgi:hypothetical protein
MALRVCIWNLWAANGRYEAWFIGKIAFISGFVAETKQRQRLHFPRTTLLVVIERRCTFPDCAAKNQIGLTKQEAIEYRGFECSQCERWNDDCATQSE